MTGLLAYEMKAGALLLAFCLSYHFLLRKETFHRFNRIVLVGSAVLSFLLPLCVITLHRPAETASVLAAAAPRPETAPAAGPAVSLWPALLSVLFWAGVVFSLARMAFSTLSIVRIVRRGEPVLETDGCKVIVTDRETAPFSWMRYIILSRADWEGDHAAILAHEKAHISLGHSGEVLLTGVLSAFQWFNPAVRLLRADLQELHEYEADDAVLRTGTDIKEYQYLLIRKAAGRSGCPLVNSFNNSILKNRITMMSKSRSPFSRGLRALYLLPLVCLCIGLQAQTVYETVPPDGAAPLFVLRQSRSGEKVITRAEFDKIEPNRISSLEIMKDTSAKEKYGQQGANGVVIVTLKGPQELEEIVVVRYPDAADAPAPSCQEEPDTMPGFQGEEASAFSRWLSRRIHSACRHTGTMNVSFVVGADGLVRDVEVTDGVCEELDALVVSLVRQSPKWEPATAGGRPVEQSLTVPISVRQRSAR